MDPKENQDVFDSLLDSYTMDDTMERKIHEFSQNKKRSRRIQRARDESAKFQETYSRKDTVPQDEIVLGSADLQTPEQPDVQATMAIPKEGAARSFSSQNGIQHGPSATQSTMAHTFGTASEASHASQSKYGSLNAQQEALRKKVYGSQDLSATQNAASVPHLDDQATMAYTNVNQAPNYASNHAAYMQNGADSYGHLEDTLVHQPASGQPSMQDYWNQQQGMSASAMQQPISTDHTMVYGTGAAAQDGTVVMDSQQLQNIMADEGPALKREYVAPSMPDPRASRSFSWKIPITVMILVALGLAGFSGWQMVQGWIGSLGPKTELTDSSYFQDLLSWAQSYSSLSDAEKKDITSLERMYNRLSDSQKSEIDKVLTSITGKSFDELLASASGGEKEETGNNNTEVAEKKAELKAKIRDLQTQIDEARGGMNSVQSLIDTAFATLTDKNNAREKAKQDLGSAQGALEEAQATLGGYQDRINTLQTELTSAQADLDSLLADQDPGATEENPSILNARDKVQNIQNEISTVQGQMAPAQQAVSDAQKAVDDAQSAYNYADQEASSAQSNYDAVKNSKPDSQTKIDELQSQIDALQRELDKL